MAKEGTRVSFEEFANNLTSLFRRVVRDHATLVVEGEAGEQVLVTPGPVSTPIKRPSEADYEAFLSAAGSWADVDTDALLKDLYESRRQSSRPPVEL